MGVPITLAGGDSAQTTVVRALIARLRHRLLVPVTEWDERLTSVQAARAVGARKTRRDGVVDSAAAALLLQAVLDRRRGDARR